jgi:hypothetical protein
MKSSRHITFESRCEVARISKRKSEKCEYWVVYDTHDVNYVCFDEGVSEECDRARMFCLQVILSGKVERKTGATFLNVTKVEEWQGAGSISPEIVEETDTEKELERDSG